MTKNVLLLLSTALCVTLVGCASKPQVKSSTRYLIVPDSYVVQAGDSLSAIAARYGMDYMKVAAINNIAAPYRIYVNQRIRLKASALTTRTTQTQTLSPVSVIERQSVKTAPILQPVVPTLSSTTPRGTASTIGSATSSSTISTNSALKSSVNSNVISNNTNQELTWVRPTAAPITQGFDAAKNIKGIRFSGQQGDAIFAAAKGQVVYADNGLKEYGNLVLIKHMNGYITAYAHNSKLLVKKGENVVSGQKIAEMGSTGASSTLLEFQVRLNGKPIDPRSIMTLK